MELELTRTPAKKEKVKRPKGSTLVCELTGKKFQYIGHGRPPKYSPEAKKQRLKEQRKASRDKAKAKRKAA